MRVRFRGMDAGADRDGIPRPSGSLGLPPCPREPDLSSRTDRHHIVARDGRNDQLSPRGHGRFLLAPPARPLIDAKYALAAVRQELIQQVDVEAAFSARALTKLRRMSCRLNRRERSSLSSPSATRMRDTHQVQLMLLTPDGGANTRSSALRHDSAFGENGDRWLRQRQAVRLSVFHPLSANSDALLVEIDLGPKQAPRFFAPERIEQQETERSADVVRGVFDRVPDTSERCDRWRVITRTAWPGPIIAIDAVTRIGRDQLALHAPVHEPVERVEHLATLECGAVDGVEHQADGGRVDRRERDGRRRQ